MRLSCSLALIAVFLVLRSEAAPINVSTSTLEAPGVHLSSIANDAVHGLAETLLKREVLPLDTNHLLNANLVRSGSVGHLGQQLAPITGHTAAHLGGLGLPTLAHASIAFDGLLGKRNLEGISSFGDLGNMAHGIPAFSALPASMPDVASIPGAASVQGLASGLGGNYFNELESIPGAFQKRDVSDAIAPFDTFSSLASGVPGVSTLSSVPLFGAMPDISTIPGASSLGSIPGADSISSIAGDSAMYKRGIFSPLGNLGQSIPFAGSIPGSVSAPLSSLNHLQGATKSVGGLAGAYSAVGKTLPIGAMGGSLL